MSFEFKPISGAQMPLPFSEDLIVREAWRAFFAGILIGRLEQGAEGIIARRPDGRPLMTAVGDTRHFRNRLSAGRSLLLKFDTAHRKGEACQSEKSE